MNDIQIPFLPIMLGFKLRSHLKISNDWVFSVQFKPNGSFTKTVNKRFREG
jgi:hypothetical protein